jgi:hypothetical protein
VGGTGTADERGTQLARFDSSSPASCEQGAGRQSDAFKLGAAMRVEIGTSELNHSRRRPLLSLAKRDIASLAGWNRGRALSREQARAVADYLSGFKGKRLLEGEVLTMWRDLLRTRPRHR